MGVFDDIFYPPYRFLAHVLLLFFFVELQRQHKFGCIPTKSSGGGGSSRRSSSSPRRHGIPLNHEYITYLLAVQLVPSGTW